MKTSPLNQAWHRVAVILAACLISVHAHAQWQWIDAEGKNVFSDMAPPTSVPTKNIIQRPGAYSTGSSTVDASKTAPSSPSELGKKVEGMKAAENAEAQAQKERDAQAIAENCNRARRSQAGLKSGERLRITNAKGEPDYLSDEARTAELQRAEDYIRNNCN